MHISHSQDTIECIYAHHGCRSGPDQNARPSGISNPKSMLMLAFLLSSQTPCYLFNYHVHVILHISHLAAVLLDGKSPSCAVASIMDPATASIIVIQDSANSFHNHNHSSNHPDTRSGLAMMPRSWVGDADRLIVLVQNCSYCIPRSAVLETDCN